MMKARGSIVSKGALAMVAVLGAACQGEATQATGGASEVESTTQALTTVDIDRVLGFEETTVTDWSIIQSGPGTLSVSTTASQGSRSLAVASHGYVPVQSVALSSLGSRVGSVIHYDIMSPTQLKQISPTSYGATQLYLNSTSLGLNNVYLGQVELTPLPLGQWNTVTFTPTSSVLTKLRGTYTDLRVTIVVNAPYNATQTYLLDNLRFSDSTLALVNVVDGSGHAISGITVTAYNGSTPTTNTGVTDSTGLAEIWVPPGSYRFGVTEAGVTTYSSTTNQCQVPGVCAAATIIAKCHGVVCTAKDTCHNVGICDPNTGTCSNPAKPAGTICRAAAGPCDLAEVCDGTGAACPADALAPVTTVCRASAGPCDVAETCTGASAACPADTLAPVTTVCRASAGPCDVAETCTGTSAACPPDGLLQASFACRPAAGLCDATELCSGTSAACPPDAFLPASTICRPSTGTCDPAESCSGSGPTCPSDVTTTPPAAPTGLSASNSSSGVTLTWTASTGATSYNVKRSTSGSPFTTIASPASSPYTDPSPANGSIYYYAVTAVNGCGESGYQGSVSGQVSLAPTPSGLDPLPAPPSQPGCYVGSLHGWLQTDCVDPTTILDGFTHLDTAHDGLQSIAYSSGGISQPAVPLVYGQVEATVTSIGSETNGNDANSPGWSIQNNTNVMSCNGTDQCVVQFAACGDGVKGATAVCIEPWRFPAGGGDPIVTNYCVGANGQASSVGGYPVFGVTTRKGGLHPGDFANVAAYAYTANGQAQVALVAQFSWVSDQDTVASTQTALPNLIPGLYAIVTPDQYGAAQGWTTVTGGLMGLKGGTQANFTNAEVFTRVAASNCQGDVSASGPICPSQPILSANNVQHTTVSGFGTTVESNNLALTQATPGVTFPNQNLAVSTMLATTNIPDGGAPTAGCLPGQESHLYIRDNEGDSGGTPSNAGGIPFWESPDIFVLPQDVGAPQPNDVASDLQLTANHLYNVYLRVHNEFGCNPVNGPINVFIEGADPNMGFTYWSKVTDGADLGEYTTYGSAGTLIAPAYGVGIIGPFSWTPDDGGHKCLLAAIAASNETEPPASASAPVLPPAYSSNQIAQRNVQIGSSCTYSITNSSSASANLQLGISVTPATPAPGSAGGPTISFVFSDSGGAWAAEWQGLAGLSSVTNDGTKTTVVLSSSYVALTSVPLAAGQSPSVSLNITPVGNPPTVNVSALLTDPETGDILQQNGGSCTGTQPIISY